MKEYFPPANRVVNLLTDGSYGCAVSDETIFVVWWISFFFYYLVWTDRHQGWTLNGGSLFFVFKLFYEYVPGTMENVIPWISSQIQEMKWKKRCSRHLSFVSTCLLSGRSGPVLSSSIMSQRMIPFSSPLKCFLFWMFQSFVTHRILVQPSGSYLCLCLILGIPVLVGLNRSDWIEFVGQWWSSMKYKSTHCTYRNGYSHHLVFPTHSLLGM